MTSKEIIELLKEEARMYTEDGEHKTSEAFYHAIFLISAKEKQCKTCGYCNCKLHIYNKKEFENKKQVSNQDSDDINYLLPWIL